MGTLWPKRADTFRMTDHNNNQSEAMQIERRSLWAHYEGMRADTFRMSWLTIKGRGRL